MSLQNDVTIKRIKDKTNGFTIVANDIFKRDDVSARAKGVYIYILTLPDDWQIYKSELYTHFSEGRGAIDTAFKELERLGYIEKKRAKDENGKFKGWDYIVYESPTNRKPDSREIRNRENRQSENQQLLSTDKQSTDKKQNTDNIYEYGVQMYDKSTPEIERELDKEIEIDKETDKIPYDEIIAYLNEKTSSRYRSTDTTKKLIRARMEEGFTKDDCFTVIDNKVATWKGTEWEKYLRPSTLFNASKFQGYLNEKPVEKKHAGSKEGYSVDITKYDTI